MNKKIIITKEQLKRLDEVATVTLPTDNGGSTPGDIVNTINNNKSQIDAASNATPGGVDVVVTTPKNNETLPPQVVNVDKGDNISNAVNAQLDTNYTQNGGATKITGSGIGGVDNTAFEGKAYTKKQIEEARKLYLSTFQSFTKGQLNEIYDNAGGVDRKALIDYCQNYGDFLYLYEYPLNGRIILAAANTDEIVNSIISDLYRDDVKLTYTHEVDYKLEYQNGLEEGDYQVVKVENAPSEPETYYIVWEE